MWELDTLASKNYMVTTLAQVTSVSEGDWGLVAGVLDRGNKLGKSSHSCGKLHYFYNDFVCEDKGLSKTFSFAHPYAVLFPSPT